MSFKVFLVTIITLTTQISGFFKLSKNHPCFQSTPQFIIETRKNFHSQVFSTSLFFDVCIAIKIYGYLNALSMRDYEKLDGTKFKGLVKEKCSLNILFVKTPC